MKNILQKFKRSIRRKLNQSANQMVMGRRIEEDRYYLAVPVEGRCWPFDFISYRSWSAARRAAKKRGMIHVKGSTLISHHQRHRDIYQKALKRAEDKCLRQQIKERTGLEVTA